MGWHTYGDHSLPSPSLGSPGCCMYPRWCGTWEENQLRAQVAAAPLYLALGSHKEGWAVLGDQGGCCVNERKPVCNCVLCQAVLFCQKSAKQERERKDCCVTKMGRKERRVDKGPACLVDNSAKISNIADLKFAMNWAQTHLRCRVIWTSI